MSKLFNTITLFLLLLSSGVYAINMGSVVKNDFEKIIDNESAKFTILFWNIENESYILKLDARELPDEWIIMIDPNNFILNASVGKEYISLPYMNGGIKATPVDVIVKPPPSSKPGRYNISLSARTESPNNGISFSQERLFNFSVEIENPIYFEKSEKQNVNQNNEKSTSLFYSLKQESTNLDYFYAIIIVLILLFSFLIYKYS